MFFPKSASGISPCGTTTLPCRPKVRTSRSIIGIKSWRTRLAQGTDMGEVGEHVHGSGSWSYSRSFWCGQQRVIGGAFGGRRVGFKPVFDRVQEVYFGRQLI